jgi:hypothetical protein
VFAADDDISVDVSLPGWVIDAGLKFINNPDDVFYNFHLDNVDYTPVMAEKKASLRTNFLTTFFPFSWGNANLKLKVLSDSSYHDFLPQIDLVGNYGRILALDFMPDFEGEDSTDTIKMPTMVDYSIGFLMTKAVSRETRIYAGFQYSVIAIKYEFSEPIELTDEASIDKIDINRKDYIMVMGISNLIDEKKQKRIQAYLGYGFSYKKIFSRFAWYHEHLELGFNIYPEGLLVVHPFLGWHWDF